MKKSIKNTSCGKEALHNYRTIKYQQLIKTTENISQRSSLFRLAFALPLVQQNLFVMVSLTLLYKLNHQYNQTISEFLQNVLKLAIRAATIDFRQAKQPYHCTVAAAAAPPHYIFQNPACLACLTPCGGPGNYYCTRSLKKEVTLRKIVRSLNSNLQGRCARLARLARPRPCLDFAEQNGAVTTAACPLHDCHCGGVACQKSAVAALHNEM